MYLKRKLEDIIKEASTNFRVVLLTGPRQVGKTTLLAHLEKNHRSYVSLDDMNMRLTAEQDPAGFIENLQLPVLIDEVQYAPEVFPYIKMKVDSLKEPGQFWLTGSQQFEMMKNVSESLAGRVVILKLTGISLAEEQHRIDTTPFIPRDDVIKSRRESAKYLNASAIYQKIWRGSYPDIVISNGKFWENFYESYITTYIQKDIRDYLNINNIAAFHKFMQIAAARTGQMINYKDISRDTGVSEPTVKHWLQALQASGIVFLLQPYANNLTKRIVKTPKLYFMDTGLCCYLTGWLNATVLERGAMAGAMLETYVVSEIIKSYFNNGKNPRIYFYRDKDKREIDLLIEENGIIYPLEIKKTASLKNIDIKNFNALNNLKVEQGKTTVLCFIKDLTPINREINAIPISWV